MKKLMVVLTFALLFSMAAFAQDYPKFEVPVGFSFVNVHPDITQITSFNIFGGGGGFVYNVTPWIGIKADFEGYTQGSGLKNQLKAQGYAGQANGNVFTYMFGPQIKKHSGKLQPFGQALFGAAHSNLYAQIYNAQTGLDRRAAATTMLSPWSSVAALTTPLPRTSSCGRSKWTTSTPASASTAPATPATRTTSSILPA